jgi:hypothetical protein
MRVMFSSGDGPVLWYRSVELRGWRQMMIKMKVLHGSDPVNGYVAPNPGAVIVRIVSVKIREP